MPREYKTIQEIAGPLMLVRDVEGAAYNELGEIELSDKCSDIDGGFILIYGGIEENCSFKALIDDNVEIFQDKVQKVLFG